MLGRNLLSLTLVLVALSIINMDLSFIGLEQLSAFANNRKGFMDLPDNIYSNNFVTTEGQDFVQRTGFVSGTIMSMIKLLIGSVATLFAIVAAMKIIVKKDDESVLDEAKRTFLYSIMGFAFILMSDELGKILSLTEGGFFGDKQDVINRVRIFDNQIAIIVTLLKYVSGSVAVFFMTKSGMRLIVGNQNDDNVSKDKQKLTIASLGLVALVMSNNIISNVLYSIDNPFSDPTIDPGQGVAEIIGFTNFIVSFISPVLILTLVTGGVMVAGSGFSEDANEKGKKMIKLSIAGIGLVYGSFAIVSTIISGSF